MARRVKRCLGGATLLAALCAPPLWAQTTGAGTQAEQQPAAGEKEPETGKRLGKSLFNLLNMAGTQTGAEFRPLDQRQRNRLYLESLANPLGFVRVGLSAGLDQWGNKPHEWGQGGAGYGRRYGNIFGQYTIQRTASFGLSSALGEDNRYFNSGKKGFWRRTWYAVTSGLLARHRDGHRSLSFSQIGSVAAGAFLARLWLPRSQNSAGDGAVSFGLSMAGNAGANIFKEFLPDVIHAFVKRPKSDKQQAANR